MKCRRPEYNHTSGQWAVWDFSYEENGERYYELHPFWTFKEAIDFWKSQTIYLNTQKND